MKYDYEKLSTGRISAIYEDLFGESFRIQLGDEDDHRDEIIACIERGYPQQLEEVGPLRECVIY